MGHIEMVEVWKEKVFQLPLMSGVRHYSSNTIIKNGFYGIVEVAIPLVLMLITTPMFIHKMGTESYGLWTIALAFLGLIGVFDFGISVAVIKYLSEYYEKNNLADLSAVVGISLAISSFVGILFGTVLFLNSNTLSVIFQSNQISSKQVELILKVISLGLFPMMLQNVGLAIPRGFQDYRITAIVLLIQNTLTVLFALVIVLLNGAVLHVMAGTVIMSWITACASLYIGWKKMSAVGAKLRVSLKTSKIFFRYILFMGLSGLGTTIFTMLDRIVIGQVLGLSAAAYYSIATGVANKFVTLASVTTRSLLPAFSSWGVGKDVKKMKAAYIKATMALGVLILAPGVVFLLFSKHITVFWLGEKTGTMVLPVMRVLIFIYSTRIIAMPAFHALNGLNFPHITTFTSLTAGIGAVLLIYLVAPRYGLLGAAWANSAAWISFYMIVFLLVYLNKQESRT